MLFQKFARLAKITARSYHSIETGKGNPTLATINSLALALEVTSSRLISLNLVRLQESVEKFTARYIEELENAKIGVSLRNFEGELLYRNKKFKKIINLPENSSGKVELMKILPPGSRETLRAQLSSERSGLAFPYTNFGTDIKTKESMYFRFYPCLVFPSKGRDAHFSALYMTPLSEDCQKNYFQFCEALLKIIQKTI